MKSRGFLVLISVLVLAMFLTLFIPRRHNPPIIPGTATNTYERVAAESQSSGNFNGNFERTFKPLPSHEKPSDAIYDPGRMGDPDYNVLVKKFMARRDYLNSPAKETPECQEILRLLSNEGVGIDAVRDAYNAAWNYQTHLKMTDQMGNSEGAKMLLADSRQNDETPLRTILGITNQAFFDELFKIKPKIFFGMRNMALRPGASLETTDK